MSEDVLTIKARRIGLEAQVKVPESLIARGDEGIAATFLVAAISRLFDSLLRPAPDPLSFAGKSVVFHARASAIGTAKRIEGAEQVPADWIQALRERWLPAWWLARFPLKTRRIATMTVEHRVCPHMNRGKGSDGDLLCLSFVGNWNEIAALERASLGREADRARLLDEAKSWSAVASRSIREAQDELGKEARP